MTYYHSSKKLQKPYNRGQEAMARKPDVALLITTSGSFVDKHQLFVHKRKRSAHTRFQK